MNRELIQRITNYLAAGGLVNPELMEHEKVRDLLIDCRDELAKPEQATVPFPSFMRKRIEEAIDSAINPKGMSVHDGKATVYASDLQRMIAVIDLAPPRKPWIGLTNDEIWECQKPGLSDDVYKLIEAKLREKNT
jgi:hypothetical protein